MPYCHEWSNWREHFCSLRKFLVKQELAKKKKERSLNMEHFMKLFFVEITAHNVWWKFWAVEQFLVDKQKSGTFIWFFFYEGISLTLYYLLIKSTLFINFTLFDPLKWFCHSPPPFIKTQLLNLLYTEKNSDPWNYYDVSKTLITGFFANQTINLILIWLSSKTNILVWKAKNIIRKSFKNE